MNAIGKKRRRIRKITGAGRRRRGATVFKSSPVIVSALVVIRNAIGRLATRETRTEIADHGAIVQNPPVYRAQRLTEGNRVAVTADKRRVQRPLIGRSSPKESGIRYHDTTRHHRT